MRAEFFPQRRRLAIDDQRLALQSGLRREFVYEERWELNPLALFGDVMRIDRMALRVVQADADVIFLDQFAHFIADTFEDGVDVQFLGEHLSDLVEDFQLGGAALRLSQQVLSLIEEARVFDGNANGVGNCRQQAHI